MTTRSFVAACVLVPALAFAAPPKAAKLPTRTDSGVTFAPPADWKVVVGKQRLVFTAPENDFVASLFETEAADANAAEELALTAQQPKAPRRKVLQRTEQPARNGWDQRQLIEYETSPNEKRYEALYVLRKGTRVTLVLLQGALATAQKRNAQLTILVGSLLPAGFRAESFAGKKPAPLDDAKVKLLVDFVSEAQRTLDIPGIGFSIFSKDRVLYENGLGVKQLGAPAPVTPDTRFLIASNTKALVTLLLAQLVDEKKLSWNTPVVTVLPQFKLGPTETTNRVLLRHLVCACTGLPRQDFEWMFEFAKTTPLDALALLGTMTPTSRFGELFQYSNPLVAAAGWVGGHMAFPDLELGAAFDRAMDERILRPLAMATATFDAKMALTGDVALPHARDLDGKTRVANNDFNRSIVPLRPAGGLWASVRDLRKLAQLELARGVLPNGKRLVGEANLLERRKPVVAISRFSSYGMGLMLESKWDVPVVHHGGAMLGYQSDFVIFPEIDLGIAFVTNADSGVFLRRALVRRVLEVLFGGAPEAGEDLAAANRDELAAIATARGRLTIPPPAEIGRALAKRYTHPTLGDITVRRDGARVIFDVGEWQSDVGSRQNDDDTISLWLTSPGLALDFVVGRQDGAPTLTLRDPQHEYRFVAVQ